MPWDDDRENYTFPQLLLLKTLPKLTKKQVKNIKTFLQKNYTLLEDDEYLRDDYCCADDGMQAATRCYRELLVEAYKDAPDE